MIKKVLLKIIFNLAFIFNFLVLRWFKLALRVGTLSDISGYVYEPFQLGKIELSKSIGDYRFHHKIPVGVFKKILSWKKEEPEHSNWCSSPHSNFEDEHVIKKDFIL